MGRSYLIQHTGVKGKIYIHLIRLSYSSGAGFSGLYNGSIHTKRAQIELITWTWTKILDTFFSHGKDYSSMTEYMLWRLDFYIQHPRSKFKMLFQFKVKLSLKVAVYVSYSSQYGLYQVARKCIFLYTMV